MVEFKVDGAVCVDKGLVRANNEDNFYFNGIYLDCNTREIPGVIAKESEDALQIYAVCDGMGGEEGGEDASFIAVSTLEKYRELFAENDVYDIDKYMNMYTFEAGNLIYEKSCENGNSRMGTTMAAAVINDGRLFSYNVGDTRVYRLRSSKLTLLSEDHTPAYRAYKMGMIKKDEIKTHPHRNKLTQYMGISSAEMIIKPYATFSEALDGDVYLLCSDGISDFVDEVDIKAVLKTDADAEWKASSLVSLALENGGKDNSTALVLQIKTKTSFFKRLRSAFKK